jgi:hypothetical protein
VSDVDGHVGVQSMAAVDLYDLRIGSHATDGGVDRFSQFGQWDARPSKEDDFKCAQGIPPLGPRGGKPRARGGMPVFAWPRGCELGSGCDIS